MNARNSFPVFKTQPRPCADKPPESPPSPPAPRCHKARRMPRAIAKIHCPRHIRSAPTRIIRKPGQKTPHPANRHRQQQRIHPQIPRAVPESPSIAWQFPPQSTRRSARPQSFSRRATSPTPAPHPPVSPPPPANFLPMPEACAPASAPTIAPAISHKLRPGGGTSPGGASFRSFARISTWQVRPARYAMPSITGCG